ncbi:MAG: hypothetical protein JJT99_11650 [Rhodobacteraceae bacterium]|nr:hypothetical protein [Paracoccaceae bacterium]
MREVTQGDIRAAARVLAQHPACARAGLMAAMLQEADHADRYRKVFGRVHPRLGNGTLMAAALARARARPAPRLSERDGLECLVLVVHAVLAWRVERAQMR